MRRRFSTGRSFVVEGNLFVVNAAALLIKADILLGTVTEDIEAFRHLFPKKTTEWFSSPNNHANQHAPWICIGYHGIEFLTEPKLAQTNDINVVSPFCARTPYNETRQCCEERGESTLSTQQRRVGAAWGTTLNGGGSCDEEDGWV